jgi:hypothetical protein
LSDKERPSGIISLVPKGKKEDKKERTKVTITYTDGQQAVIICDGYGQSFEITSFLLLIEDLPSGDEFVKTAIHIDSIKRLDFEKVSE